MSCFHRAVYVIFVLFITFLNFFIRFLKFSFLCYVYVKLLINYLVLDIFLSVVQMCVAVVVRIYILRVLFVECNFAWNLSLGLLYIIFKNS